MIFCNTDAHGVDTLDNMHYSVATARRAWLSAEQIANTRPWRSFAPAAASARIGERAPRPAVRGRVPAGGPVPAQARCPDEPHRLKGRAGLDVEADAVALLDRGHGPLAGAQGQRGGEREPGRRRPRRREEDARARRPRARRPPAATGARARRGPGCRWAASGSFGLGQQRAHRVGRARRPAQEETDPHRDRPPDGGDDQRPGVVVAVGGDHGDGGQGGRCPRASSTVIRSRSQKGTDGLSASARSTSTKPSGPSTVRSAFADTSGAPRRRRRRCRRSPRAHRPRAACAAPRTRRRRCGRPRRRARPDGPSGDQRRDRDALVDRDVGPDLQHLAPAVRDQALPVRVGLDLARQRLGLALVLRSAPVQGDDRALVLDADPGALQVTLVEPGDEGAGVLVVPVQRGVRVRLAVARQQQLEAVVARVGDLVEADDTAGVERGAAADAATSAYWAARALSSSRDSSGTSASSGRSTIGASVPSTSNRIAAEPGSRRSGASSFSI